MADPELPDVEAEELPDVEDPELPELEPPDPELPDPELPEPEPPEPLESSSSSSSSSSFDDPFFANAAPAFPSSLKCTTGDAPQTSADRSRRIRNERTVRSTRLASASHSERARHAVAPRPGSSNSI
ncbi:MAG: hypothetical protein F9K34_13520 [Albidovulum sp.]|uniref:hypothetical protein n=1 Tax=Albidovulum sp. TaxID=1872424 RepID=UPI001327B9CF|nr:hypothetical protein [Defluviimonas sp.]KAB2882800.1 MAG: hypothetical protein F9K34_13520 [Defluviimonas sp.]